MDTINHLFAGRTLALDRSALPSLASQAAMRAAGASLDQLAHQRAGLLDGRESGAVSVRRIGSTAIVPLVGLITSDLFLAWIFGGTSPDALVQALQQAIADPEVKDILLLVNSPGGEVSLLTETAAEIRRLRAIKTITAIARTQMASAAYWLAAQASRVIATPSADVGSVGVFLVHEEQSRLLDKVGITVTYITSDPRKIEGNSDQPLADEAVAFLQARVNDVYRTFIADLALGRGIPAARVQSDFGGGRCFGATEAVRRGMADGITTVETLIAAPSSSSRSGRSASQLVADEHEAILAVLSNC